MDKQLTLYDYVSYVVPGGLLLFVIVYGYDGWPRAEPGSSGLIGIIAAAFVVGHVVAVVGTWVEAAFLGGRPGRRPDPLWGTLGDRSRYSDEERAELRQRLLERYGDVEVAVAFRLGQTELQQAGKDGPMKVATQHLGFARGLATAALLALVVDVVLAIASGTHLPLVLWIPVLCGVAVACVVRYRRAWRQFGDHLIRGVAVLPPRP